ncbi:MAG: hypothetical protein ACOYL5_17290 [Phototrophicaceae bacterium]|jgi:hypothetical protein
MFIVVMQRDNDFTVTRLAQEFTLSEEAILAGLLYYHEHKAQMDAQDATDIAESNAMHAKYAPKAP